MAEKNIIADDTVTTVTDSLPSQSKGQKFLMAIKEWFRKQLVKLKRSPQNIILLFMLISLVVYSLNMTAISNATAYIQGNSMGLCSFVTFLVSILYFVVFFNAFPKRQKIRLVMFIILIVLIALIIFCDIIYYMGTYAPFTREENPWVWDEVKPTYQNAISTTRNVLLAHIALLCFTLLLVATFPLYKNLIKKINTSVEVEEGAVLNEIERADDE